MSFKQPFLMMTCWTIKLYKKI